MAAASAMSSAGASVYAGDTQWAWLNVGVAAASADLSRGRHAEVGERLPQAWMRLPIIRMANGNIARWISRLAVDFFGCCRSVSNAVEQADEDVGRGPGGPPHKTGLVFALRDNQRDVIVLFARAKPLHLVEHGIEQGAWG